MAFLALSTQPFPLIKQGDK